MEMVLWTVGSCYVFGETIGLTCFVVLFLSESMFVVEKTQMPRLLHICNAPSRPTLGRLLIWQIPYVGKIVCLVMFMFKNL